MLPNCFLLFPVGGWSALQGMPFKEFKLDTPINHVIKEAGPGLLSRKLKAKR